MEDYMSLCPTKGARKNNRVAFSIANNFKNYTCILSLISFNFFIDTDVTP